MCVPTPHWRARDVEVWAQCAHHKNKIGNTVPMRARRKQTLYYTHQTRKHSQSYRGPGTKGSVPNFGPWHQHRLVLTQVLEQLNHFYEKTSNNLTNFVWLLNYLTTLRHAVCCFHPSMPGKLTANKNVVTLTNILLFILPSNIFIFHTVYTNNHLKFTAHF